MEKLGVSKNVPKKEYYCIQCGELHPEDELTPLNDGSVICNNCNENDNSRK